MTPKPNSESTPQTEPRRWVISADNRAWRSTGLFVEYEGKPPKPPYIEVIEASAYDSLKAERDASLEREAKLLAALQFYADGRHVTEIDHEVIQVVPGSDEFIDHVIGRTAREALAEYEKGGTK